MNIFRYVESVIKQCHLLTPTRFVRVLLVATPIIIHYPSTIPVLVAPIIMQVQEMLCGPEGRGLAVHEQTGSLAHRGVEPIVLDNRSAGRHVCGYRLEL